MRPRPEAASTAPVVRGETDARDAGVADAGAPDAAGKIREIDELAAIAADLRARGRTVVQCHGVFDLLHIGHIRHFAEARRLGHALIVTLTEDRHVNKGPHRPAFPERLRAEALAALADVDYVAVSRHPTAAEAIAALKPDVFVKGPDYRDASTDVTGGIAPERDAVVAAGGRIHFTDAPTHSSSTLINRHLATFPDDVRAYLRRLRERYAPRDVVDVLDRLRDLDVAVVGEAIVDEYVYCDQMGKSAKDPVLAMRYGSSELFAGGSLAIANHVAGFVRSVELVAYLGDRDAREDFARGRLKANVRANFVYKADSPTIVKRRYVESYLRSKHFEVYFINDEPMAGDGERELCALLAARLTGVDAAIAADFGHGMLTPAAIGVLAGGGRFLAVNTQINAANVRYHSISAYDRADYVCMNENEVRLDARSRRGPLGDLARALGERLGCPRVLVTRGKEGVEYFERGEAHASPSLAAAVVDRTGSGDAVLAITSLAARVEAPPELVAFLANVVGAQKVQVVGNRSAIDRAATIKFVEALLK